MIGDARRWVLCGFQFGECSCHAAHDGDDADGGCSKIIFSKMAGTRENRQASSPGIAHVGRADLDACPAIRAAVRYDELDHDAASS
jgi:hypothetical protein